MISIESDASNTEIQNVLVNEKVVCVCVYVCVCACMRARACVVCVCERERRVAYQHILFCRKDNLWINIMKAFIISLKENQLSLLIRNSFIVHDFSTHISTVVADTPSLFIFVFLHTCIGAHAHTHTHTHTHIHLNTCTCAQTQTCTETLVFWLFNSPA